MSITSFLNIHEPKGKLRQNLSKTLYYQVIDNPKFKIYFWNHELSKALPQTSFSRPSVAQANFILDISEEFELSEALLWTPRPQGIQLCW